MESLRMNIIIPCLVLVLTNIVRSEQSEDGPLLLPIPIGRSYHEGARVTLLCTPEKGDVDSIKYEWFRHDANDKPSEFPIATDRGTGHSALVFRNVEAKDSGKYTCVASNKFGSHNVSAVLNVDVPLKWKTEPMNQSARVGESISMECQAFGQPDPTISWIRLRSMATNVTIAGPVLHFSSLTQNDTGFYECIASNGIDKNLRKVIELEVKDAPILLPIPMAKSYHEGAHVTLVCTAAGGDVDSIKYEWFKHDTNDKLSEFPIATDRGVGHSIMIFKNVQAKDSGKYTCVASNRFGNHSVSAVLNVNECQAFGQPEPTVRWAKLKAGNSSTIAGPTLHFTSLQQNDAGIYECVASNGIDKSLRKVIDLVVKDGPRLLPISMASTYREGTRVSMICNLASGEVDSLKYEWFKHDSNDKPSAFPISTDRGAGHSILILKNVEAKNSGKYTCVASNRFGSHNVSAILNVDVPLKWKIEPTNTVARAGAALFVECQASGQPEPTIHWTRLGKSNNVTIPGLTLHFPSLAQDAAGLYECVASNGVDKNLKKVIELEVKEYQIKLKSDFEDVSPFNLELECLTQ
ncbi:Hemicentin-1, partial [Fragariocoptes setiger]